jgi:hypothetical protein
MREKSRTKSWAQPFPRTWMLRPSADIVRGSWGGRQIDQRRAWAIERGGSITPPCFGQTRIRLSPGSYPESVAIRTELAVQLPVETRPVVDERPRDEKYAAHVCEDSRSRGWSLDLGE